LLAVSIFTLISVVVGKLSTEVGSVRPDMPAALAGLEKGDRILAVDGESVSQWEDLSGLIRASGGKALSIRIRRAGQEVEVNVQPEEREGRDEFGEKKKIWFIGITRASSIEKIPPWVALWQGCQETVAYSVLTVKALYRMVTGSLSTDNLGGPILIAQIAGKQAREGMRNFFYFVAILSVNLGVLNLLPIPVLDGGHLLFLLFEWVLGRPLEIKHRERAQQVGVFFLILVMIYAFYNDIARFFEG
ncbi:MAG: RIP metalloprotease RseP, partial [Candidatus Binatia bacterium]|nr:RIP metalloprotease RseP [Candidatus Binatia bacterium]